ncbi:hypothetical protein [Asticcacaulis solisilvae]|uniref:hypothetical protein n=1 Tax=Asticcacaulis solisilvae TaxID=1217274 RepID=UPI003FD79627
MKYAALIIVVGLAFAAVSARFGWLAMLLGFGIGELLVLVALYLKMLAELCQARKLLDESSKLFERMLKILR